MIFKLKLIVAVLYIISVIFALTYYKYFNAIFTRRPRLIPKTRLSQIVLTKVLSFRNHTSNKKTILTQKQHMSKLEASLINEKEHLSKITSKSALRFYERKLRNMDGSYYEVRTLDIGPVSYDESEPFPLLIDGEPRWEPETYNEFN